MKRSRFRFLVLSVVLTASLAVLAASMPGCTAQQQAQVQSDLAKAQTAYNATTQAVSDSQAELDTINNQLAQAKAIAATQPGNTDEMNVVTALQKLHDQVAAALAVVQANEVKAQAVLTSVENLSKSISTNAPPDLSPLAAFGPYGELAGLLITTGFGVYQMLKNRGTVSQVSTLVDSTGSASLGEAVAAATNAVNLIESLVHATGATSPAAAVAQAHAAIAAVPLATGTAAPAASSNPTPPGK